MVAPVAGTIAKGGKAVKAVKGASVSGVMVKGAVKARMARARVEARARMGKVKGAVKAPTVAQDNGGRAKGKAPARLPTSLVGDRHPSAIAIPPRSLEMAGDELKSGEIG